MNWQHYKIMRIMLSKPRGTACIPPTFMQSDLGDLFVGYEASARFSELARDYPDIFFEEQHGKYKARTLLWDKLKERFDAGTLPESFVQAIKDHREARFELTDSAVMGGRRMLDQRA